jgi:alpha-beta hydrolase superfamily lysophospholipase
MKATYSGRMSAKPTTYNCENQSATFSKQKLLQWTLTESSTIPKSAFIEKFLLRLLPMHHKPRFESMTIEAQHGARLAAILASPRNVPTRATVVFVHGFGGNKFENGLFSAIAEKCALKGFSAVFYDWRGVGDSEGEFQSTSLSQHVSDFQTVLAWARKRSQESDHPLCAVGFSLGAAVVGLALRQGASLDCVTYLSPAVRPRLTMWPRYNNERNWRSIEECGIVKKPGSTLLLTQLILEYLRDTDLGIRAFEVNTPLLVCHGTRDSRIDFSNIQTLVKARRRDAAAFKFFKVKGASHSFRPDITYWPALASQVSDWIDGTVFNSRTL